MIGLLGDQFRPMALRFLTQTCTVYPATHSKDAAGGYTATYPAGNAVSNVPCHIHSLSAREAERYGREVTEAEYLLVTASGTGDAHQALGVSSTRVVASYEGNTNQTFRVVGEPRREAPNSPLMVTLLAGEDKWEGPDL